jgi:Hint domain
MARRLLLDRDGKSTPFDPESGRTIQETTMTNNREYLISDAQRTRRNIMKIGVILAASAVAANSAHAGPPSSVCAVSSLCKCFLKGTKIQTVEGERKIEDPAIGDLLPTMFGGLRPVQWIGRYPIKKSDPSKPWVKDALPVRIARSALAPDVPRAYLYVTSSHSLLIDGVLVPAEALINGTTIIRYEAREYDELEFFHIKLGSHDVVYAERAPAETLADVDERAVNFAEYLRRYGTPATEEARCAPVVRIGGREELKSRLCALSPWIDLRNRADVVRDQLEERGFVDSRQFETAR